MRIKKLNKKYSRGMTLAEVVIAASMLTVFLTALVDLYNIQIRIIFSSVREVKATFLAEETLETIKYLRGDSWKARIFPLTNDTDYYLSWQNNSWQTTTTPIYVDSVYLRSFRLEPVSRDSQSNVVSSGGTVDPNSLEVISTVAWPERNATSTKVLKAYVDNILNN